MTGDTIRAEVEAWLATHWSPAIDRAAWMRLVVEAGWAAPRWPTQWHGRGLDDDGARIVEQAFARVGAPGAGQDRTNLAAGTLLAYGRDPLKRALLPRLLAAEIAICLLYSEPGAGSDLAAVRTRADPDPAGGWHITGQKVWTSGAAAAEYGLLLARTDWDAPKHKGISVFFLPMRQRGIAIRPLHQITGDTHFNEVFLDGAHVPAGNLLGPEGGGWQVLQAALAVERLIMGAGAGERRQGALHDNRLDLIAMARAHGCLDDPLIRQDIAGVVGLRQLNALSMARAKAESPGSASPLMSLGKLAMSRILHEEARVMALILGAATLLDGPDHPEAADANYRALNAYMTSIGGGTDQIQRNIIAERILGLPRETELDRDVPFRTSRAVTG